ncbi:MAG: hypothetical protein WAM11_15050 [Cyanobium sp.]
MPNVDGGHYYLSALVPLLEGPCPEPGAYPGSGLSHVQAVRQILATLPRGEQEDPSSPLPFSGEASTHFARLLVIDSLPFNGRQRRDVLAAALRRRDPLASEPIDRLPFAYLGLFIDFDAADDRRRTLEWYLRDLWRSMPQELASLMGHCRDYDDRADRQEQSFVDLVQRCQIETTMPYHDYRLLPEPGLWSGTELPAPRLGRALRPVLVLAPLLLILLLSVMWWTRLSLWWLPVAVLLWASLLLWLAQRRLLARAYQPFPAAERGNLPSVLKALYLQRQFSRFMLEQQGATPEDLRQAFAAFLAEHRPADLACPTQAAGVVPASVGP